MSTIKNFEDLEIWTSARELVKLIYSDFRSLNDFTFKNQITGAGISIMNNISEGFCRHSDAEFRQFLNIAKGSSGEVKNMYYVAEDLGYVSSGIADARREKCQKLIFGTGKLMSYLKPKNKKPPKPNDKIDS
jgi:four helix bundle protein